MEKGTKEIKKGEIMLVTNRWRTKYQMDKLKDGEYYNLRDKKIYILVDGKHVKTNRNYKRRK